MSYSVNEVFYSLQGEGARAGSANVFIRFSGCNLTCRRDVEGFDCDTEFTSGLRYTADQIVEVAGQLSPAARCGVILTGGEPTLQVDQALVDALHAARFAPVCIETNGLRPVPVVDWVSCSPKTAEHTLQIQKADELRYVRRKGMGIPKPSISATYLYLSPAFGPEGFDADDLAWCIDLVKENPQWRLSVQQHKGWRIR